MNEINSSLYIEVAVPFPVYNTYIYKVPEQYADLIAPGSRVFVPFGSKRTTGYVLGFAKAKEFKGKILSILDLLDSKPIFPKNMIPFFKWASDYYIYPIGEAIKSALPKKVDFYEQTFFSITNAGKEFIKTEENFSAQKKILESLIKKDLTIKGLRAKFGDSAPASLLYSIEKKGFVKKYSKIKGKSSFKRRIKKDRLGEKIIRDAPYPLTKEQASVIESINSSLFNGFKTFLLAGVTGSGKTEVYMNIAAKTIEKGLSVILMVPEISLISQIERRFKARFGETVAVLHSSLAAGERYFEWMKILNKEAKIAIGARSALFAPFENLGAIIVDEEHDTSYKDSGGFGYNAKDLASVRAKLANAIAILGSATPSVASYYNVISEKYEGLYLKNRIKKRVLPNVEIVDMRQKKDLKGIKKFITSELKLAIADNLKIKKQTLLFLNRRGFANLSICAQCASPLRCKRCDISLTLHQKDNIYRCHLCGYFQSVNAVCNVCGSNSIKKLGFGTEKIEAAINSLFSNAKTIRIDKDTTKKKGSLVRLLKKIKNKKADIIIGTQMIAKGHDFPDITLAGIICADISLNFPDFRAGEQTFQLLAQVAGRAGRGDLKGRVILQTFNPDHFAILSAKEQDFIKFYNQDIVFRKGLNYPPFSRLIQIKIEGKDKKKALQTAYNIGELCKDLTGKKAKNSIEILGPVESPIAKIASMFRWQILIKGTNSSTLRRFANKLFFDNQKAFKVSGIKTTIDVDPIFMM